MTPPRGLEGIAIDVQADEFRRFAMPGNVRVERANVTSDVKHCFAGGIDPVEGVEPFAFLPVHLG